MIRKGLAVRRQDSNTGVDLMRVSGQQAEHTARTVLIFGLAERIVPEGNKGISGKNIGTGIFRLCRPGFSQRKQFHSFGSWKVAGLVHIKGFRSEGKAKTAEQFQTTGRT